MQRLAWIVVFAMGCGDDDAATDAGRRDGGGFDASREDAGAGDSGRRDAATVDAASIDAGADGSFADAGSGDAGQATCTVNEDCVWGEIDHEITRREDCICLFGCPSYILNRQTRDRRQEQYTEHCDPRFDGMGDPCPVDDCITPPPLFCREGVCGM
jgi:hypothetical protein